jgi:3-oxoadipate enol-lactonase
MSPEPVSMHCVDRGRADAPALVLIHSIATHSAMWSAQIPLWSQSFRVLAVDLPGHGKSAPDPRLEDPQQYAQLIIDLLDRSGQKRCAIVGLSLGGMIGQMVALSHPERVHSLVIANSSARLPPQMHERWEARKRQALEEGMESQVNSTLERWFTPEFRTQCPITVQWVAGMIRRTHPTGYRDAIAAIQATQTFDRAATIGCPVLVVAARHDAATPVAALEQLAGVIPGAQCEVLEHAAHLSNIAQPIEFTERVGGFLARTHHMANSAAMPEVGS